MEATSCGLFHGKGWADTYDEIETWCGCGEIQVVTREIWYSPCILHATIFMQSPLRSLQQPWCSLITFFSLILSSSDLLTPNDYPLIRSPNLQPFLYPPTRLPSHPRWPPIIPFHSVHTSLLQRTHPFMHLIILLSLPLLSSNPLTLTHHCDIKSCDCVDVWWRGKRRLSGRKFDWDMTGIW